MSFAIQAKMTGLEDLFKRMEGLKVALQKKILRKALGQASKVVLKAAKANLAGVTGPESTGLLRRSLGRLTRTYRNTGTIVVLVGPRDGFRTALNSGQYADPVKYAHLVEGGRWNIAVARNARVLSNRVKVFGTSVRPTVPRPFMRPAWQSNKAKLETLVREQILEGIEEAAKS